MSALVANLFGSAPAAAQAVRETVRITSPAAFRVAPDESARQIAILPAAFAAKWLDCADGWVHIEASMGGKRNIGYVRANRTDWPVRC